MTADGEATQVTITATLRSPLLIAAARQDRIYAALDYIPGSTLRGAIASARWRSHGPEDEVFLSIVNGTRNRFPALYPGERCPSPASLSMLGCKSDNPTHGVVDVLLARHVASSSGATLAEQDDYLDALYCPCGARRRRLQGYHRDGVPLPRVVRSTRLNVGIDRRRQTAMQGVLFGSESVEPEQQSAAGAWRSTVFSGRGLLHPADIAAIQDVCSEPLLLGKKRSRGFGRVEVRITETAGHSMANRVQTIAEGSAALANRVAGSEGVPFTLTLVSPLIALDRYLRPALDPGTWLPAGLKSTSQYAILEAQSVFGWDTACGLPKDEDIAVAAGSVVLATSTLEPHALAERLAVLERSGIGERLGEGFGQVLANDANIMKQQPSRSNQ